MANPVNLGDFGAFAPGQAGVSTSGPGVKGSSTSGPGVLGLSDSGDGVDGRTKSSEKNGMFAGNDGTQENHTAGGGNGIFGRTTVPNASGVFGANDGAGGGAGVTGFSANGDGLRGTTKSSGNVGVFGRNESGSNPVGGGAGGSGVFGLALSPRAAGVFGANNNGGVGVIGIGSPAGRFVGDVEVTGNVSAHDVVLSGGDCAENFDVCGADKLEPGTVMILGDEGTLFESRNAYDKRVAGVISGAGEYEPAIVLDGRKTSGNQQPIALMGKVFCKVDAQFGTIQVGDLLTTSPTPGHAMVASDPARAFGTIIGKALRPFLSGDGLIPILVALQ